MNGSLHAIPKPFILRKVHSLLGLWLSVFLFEHLLINAQAGLFFDDQGSMFIKMVNKLHSFRFLPVLEIAFLGLPFFIHGLWGVIYARKAKYNAYRSDHGPVIKTGKNRAFTWQRITAYLLVIGVIAHVVHMRFVQYPVIFKEKRANTYVVSYPKKLDRLVKVLNDEEHFSSQVSQYIRQHRLKPDQDYFVTKSAGAAFYVNLFKAFSSLSVVVLYSLLVIAAAFHGFNGLWTFLISWGVTVSQRSQAWSRKICYILMYAVIFLGLLSAWGVFLTIKLS